ncbi:MAG: RNA 2',3'-cyclic phosphodiesterase [Candidatus Aenigmatarchaeota archaeon]|nr:RNA 2',3'-cyclic phosphodiesterase [Candidatus Aenigmarchaeota archaeon]
MKRLFVCIWIPEDLKKKIQNFQKTLENLPLKAKSVEYENLHLTITFLGDIEEKQIEDIKSKLDLIKGFKRFEVALKGLKIIPSENYIRVIGIKTESKGELEKMIKTVGELIGGSFHEHAKMTLLRVKDVKDKIYVKKFIEKNKDIEFGKFIANKLSLVESILTPSGPLYKTLYEIDLA